MLTFADPLIAKVMVHAKDREEASKKMTKVLSEAKLQGPPTNLHFLRDVVASKCTPQCTSQLRISVADKGCSFPRRRYFDEFLGHEVQVRALRHRCTFPRIFHDDPRLSC